MTTPELLARAFGVQPRAGDHRCFYCGAPCDGRNPSDVKATFTDWAIVRAPDSRYRCDGCELAMRESAEDIPGREGRPQKMRNYSWIITEEKAIALTKADRPAMREACLNPPKPPFAIALAETGQLHILFRTPINWQREPIALQLDKLTITYRQEELEQILGISTRIAAVIGTSHLLEPPTFGDAVRLHRAMGVVEAERLVESWQRLCGMPQWRLAVFLTSKESTNERTDD